MGRIVFSGGTDGSGNWVTYSYDPWGKRVLQYATSGGSGGLSTCLLYFYGANRKRLGTYNCHYSNGQFMVSTANINMYFGKKLFATGSETSQNAVITDRLGSVRGQNLSASVAYYPYGEERTSTPDNTDKFGTYFRDGYGQDYADQRYYTAVAGRFWSPDPLGHRAANPNNPTSWNLFAYVNGDPVNFRDRHGLWGYGDDDDDDDDDDGPGPCKPWTEAVPVGPLNPFAATACGPGGGGPPPQKPKEQAPTISLAAVSDCVFAQGTAIDPGVWTLEVEYQVEVNGRPVVGNNALNNLLSFISESVNVTSGPAMSANGVWCPVGSSGCSPSGSISSTGTFWDVLAGINTLTQSFLLNGQTPLPVSLSGVAGTQTVLQNKYNSSGQVISVGNGGIVGTSSTRPCGSQKGDPTVN